MAVQFAEVNFQNRNAIDVQVTVEAPIGTLVYGPANVLPGASVVIDPRVKDCVSVRISVSDAAHRTFHQTFATAPPVTGVSSYLAQV